MGVALFLKWDGFTAAQYDAARAIVGFDPATAPGGLFHVAAIDDKGIRVTDVWESIEQWEHYLTTQLMPAFAQLGIEGVPQVDVVPVHLVLAPGFTSS
jgi:hypothetical protein